MATRSTKKTVEVTLVSSTLTVLGAKRLPKSRNIGQVDLVWPRTGVAKKSAAREFAFKRGAADFTSEPWAKRVLFREEIEDHCGLAVSITEPVSVEKVRRFLRLTAKYALKMGADFMEKALVGYADIASSPIDALAQMLGEKDVPTVLAQAVIDLSSLPDVGQEQDLTIPLTSPQTGREAGSVTLKFTVL